MRARTLSAFIALVAAAVRLPAQQPAARQPSAYEELQTFSAVLNHIRVNYIDSVTLKREYVKVPSVSIVRLADAATGYVRLDQFGEKAAAEVHDALKRLRGQGATQFILDLRRNPGGAVRASVELASEFFPEKTVVFSTRGRKKDVDTTS